MTFQIFCKHYLFFAPYKAKRLPKKDKRFGLFSLCNQSEIQGE